MTFTNLVETISKLRHPDDGCPWNIDQTHESLIPYLVEETYEVIDSIRKKNDKEIIEELGDLLLQILLHSQIAKEKNRFSIDDVINSLIEKIIRRNPHVFLDKKIKISSKNKEGWEKIKSLERPLSSQRSPISNLLRRKIRPQPAQSATQIISKKVAEEGFKWESVDDIWFKLNEEIVEFKDAVNKNNTINMEEEFGDMIFTLINIAQWYELNPEECLNKTNEKFLSRFSLLEDYLQNKIHEANHNEILEAWKKAKSNFINNDLD